MEKCANCKFWDKGSCRRFPPTVIYIPYTEKIYSDFPETHDGGWCGEWKK
jgi:hypothetical protein